MMYSYVFICIHEILEHHISYLGQQLTPIIPLRGDEGFFLVPAVSVFTRIRGVRLEFPQNSIESQLEIGRTCPCNVRHGGFYCLAMIHQLGRQHS